MMRRALSMGVAVADDEVAREVCMCHCGLDCGLWKSKMTGILSPQKVYFVC